MSAPATKEEYWTLPETLRWMETQNLGRVAELSKSPHRSDPEQALDTPFARGTRKTLSRMADDLLSKARLRLVSMRGFRAEQEEPQSIDPDEIPDLHLIWPPVHVENEIAGQSTPLDIGTSYGLWSRSRNRLIWKLVQFSKADVMKEWPEGMPWRTGKVGRPSPKPLVMAELARRHEAGETAKTPREEAEYICKWLAASHPAAAVKQKQYRKYVLEYDRKRIAP